MNIFSLMKVLVLLLLTVMSDSYAGIVIGGTRLIFHGDKKEASSVLITLIVFRI